jgi:hypothetical protein
MSSNFRWRSRAPSRKSPEHPAWRGLSAGHGGIRAAIRFDAGRDAGVAGQRPAPRSALEPESSRRASVFSEDADSVDRTPETVGYPRNGLFPESRTAGHSLQSGKPLIRKAGAVSE